MYHDRHTYTTITSVIQTEVMLKKVKIRSIEPIFWFVYSVGLQLQVKLLCLNLVVLTFRTLLYSMWAVCHRLFLLCLCSMGVSVYYGYSFCCVHDCVCQPHALLPEINVI